MEASEYAGMHEDFRKTLLLMASQYSYQYTMSAKTDLNCELWDKSCLNPEDMEADETNHYHYGKTCGHRFLRGETCWRCLTCGYDETCALCQNCFSPENHAGHDVHKSVIQRDFAGCCDCGDEDAYQDSKCKYYRTPDPTQLRTNSSPEFLDQLTNYLEILTDFVIDVTNHSISCLSPSNRVEQIKLRHQMCALDRNVYHSIDEDTDKYALVLYSDQIHQYRDAIQRVKVVTGKVTEFAEMIARRCNTHGRAVVMISTDIQELISKQEHLTSTGLTACIKNSREVFREEMCDDIINWIYKFAQSNLVKANFDFMCTISKAFLRPYQSGCMTQWMDVYQNKVLLNPKVMRSPVPENLLVTATKRTSSFLQNPDWDLPESLKNDCRYYDKLAFSRSYSGSRLQFLMLFDIRFCKTSRIKLHAIYIPWIAKNAIYSKMLLAQFVDVYDAILTLFLLVDREPELSVMPLLSTQLFSSPVNASLIMKHGDAVKLIRTIYYYITTGQTLNIIQSTKDTPPESQNVVFSTLQNRKWAHALLDLTYIITRNPEIENIFDFFMCFPEYVQFLSVFQGKPVFRREAEKHIEYESQDYAVFFNAISVISHLSENIGRILNKITKDKLLSRGNPMDCWYHSYSTTMKKPFTETLYIILIRKIIEITFGDTPHGMFKNQKLSDGREDFITFELASEFCRIKYDILSDPVSFLHPLHAMLSWLIEMDRSMDSEKALLHLMDIIQGEYEYYLNERFGSSKVVDDLKMSKYEGVMGVFDIPLRKIVLVSQIKVGMWVRNGATVKNQMNLYRYGGSREFGYMRDLFLCQIYVGYFRYAQWVTEHIFDKWGLLAWLKDDGDNIPYPVTHMNSILEEFVLFIIYLVTEDLHLHKLDTDDVALWMIQREIVHSIGYDTKTYNEIASFVPDHICSLRKFPIVLNDSIEPIKNYDDICEEKQYRLKSELLPTIDPYYVHLTSNRRDHLIEKKKEYLSKRDGIALSDVVLKPKYIDWENSPFGRVLDVLLDEKVLLFLCKTLAHCRQRMVGTDADNPQLKENTESLLCSTLHLAHICMTHPHIRDVKTNELLSILRELQLLFEANVAPDLGANLKYIMKLILSALKDMDSNCATEYNGLNLDMLNENYTTMDSDNKSASDLSIDKKKKLARKKRNKLLAKLKKQQKKFADNFMADDTQDSLNSESGNEMIKSIESIQDFKLSSDDNAGPVDQNSDGNCIGAKEEPEDNEEEDCPPWKFPEQTCLMCHMPALDNDDLFGLFSYITEGNEFRYIPIESDYWFHKAFGENSDLDNPDRSSEPLEKYTKEIEEEHVIGPVFPKIRTIGEPLNYTDNLSVVSSCSHGMHLHCFKQHLDASLNKQYSQITRTTPENIKRREFSCPLCKSINNVFIPVLYHENRYKFHDNFESQLSFSTIEDSRISEKILKNSSVFSLLHEEIMEKLQENIHPSDKFIDEHVDKDGTKRYSLVSNRKVPSGLHECLISVADVSPPFETFGLAIARTIDSLEISLRGEGYLEKSQDPDLLIFQLKNRSLINLRLWMQISQIMKATLGVKRNDIPNSETKEVYTQSLVGIYRNFLDNDDLLFDGQDYFLGLVHCEESKILGFSYQRLAGVFFLRHIKQSLLMVMTMITTRASHMDWSGHTLTNYPFLTTDIFNGNRAKLGEIIASFMGEGYHNDSLIDTVYSMTVKLVTPFLRKALILAYVRYSRFQQAKVIFEADARESDRICQVMKIPTLDEMIGSMDTKVFQNVSQIRRMQLQKARVRYPAMTRLVSLPNHLNDFYTRYYNLLDDEEKYDEPAICLYCGEMVDVQNNRYGDEYGACTMHLRYECINGGRGMFFLPRNNCCLLLDNGRGTFTDSPYRDDYGELDKECKKGHTVVLSRTKYEDLNKDIWLNHNIQNVIAQKLENWTDMGGWSTL